MPLFGSYKKKRYKAYSPENKIYFSVSSEGYGHSSRAIAIAREFPAGDVIIGTYNYALERVQNLGFNSVEVPQELMLVGAQGEFDVKKTIIKNHTWALKFNDIINAEINIIMENKASCVVADGRMAPVMAAEKLGLPCIVITNQSAFYPFFEKDSPLVRAFGRSFDWMMKTWLISAEEIMIPDFPPPYTVCIDNLSRNFKVKKRTRFVGPLICFDVNNIEQIEKPAENYIVVTLGGHSYRKPLFDNVIQAAKMMKDHYFEIFTTFTCENLPDNVHLSTLVGNIAPNLNAADLVITQAGHSTAMEILALGKPAVIIPDYKQSEQERNADRMEKLQTAIKIEYNELNANKLMQAINTVMNDPKYRKKAGNFKRMAAQIQGNSTTAQIIKDYALRLSY